MNVTRCGGTNIVQLERFLLFRFGFGRKADISKMEDNAKDQLDGLNILHHQLLFHDTIGHKHD